MSRVATVIVLVVAAVCVACATPETTDTGLRSSPAASSPAGSLPPAPASERPTPQSPTPSRTPSTLAAGEWSPIDLGRKRGDRITDVTALDHGFVAVGYNCTPSDFCEDPVALSWTSEDGSSWKRHRIDDLTDVAIVGVGVGPDGLVGVGDAWSGKRWRSVALASTDGLTWHESSRISSFEPGEPPCYRDPAPGFCNASVVSGGRSTLVQNSGGMFLSADGREWELFDVTGTASPFATPDGYVMPRLLGTSDGYLAAAVISDPQANDYCLETGHPAFFYSADGSSWEQGSVTPEIRPLLGVDVDAFAAHADGGFTAVGGTYEPCGEGSITPACWSSVDGLAWRAAETGPVITEALVPAAGGVVAIALGNGADRAWFSPGGCVWQELEDVPAQADSAFVAADDTRIVLVDAFDSKALVRTPFR